MGSIQLLNLLGGKYPGKVYPVHPQQDPILNLKAYRNGRELPERLTSPSLPFLRQPS